VRLDDREEPEVLGRDHEVLERTAQTEVELAELGAFAHMPLFNVGADANPVALDRERPGLDVVFGRREDGVPQQEPRLAVHAGEA
jgi:hypothetical protein